MRQKTEKIISKYNPGFAVPVHINIYGIQNILIFIHFVDRRFPVNLLRCDGTDSFYIYEHC